MVSRPYFFSAYRQRRTQKCRYDGAAAANSSTATRFHYAAESPVSGLRSRSASRILQVGRAARCAFFSQPLSLRQQPALSPPRLSRYSRQPRSRRSASRRYSDALDEHFFQPLIFYVVRRLHCSFTRFAAAADSHDIFAEPHAPFLRFMEPQILFVSAASRTPRQPSRPAACKDLPQAVFYLSTL